MNNAHGVLKLMEVLCCAPSLIGWLEITKRTVLRSLNEIEVLGQGYPELGTYLWWISPLLSSYIPLQCTGAELSIDSLIKGSKIEQSWPSRNNLQSNREFQGRLRNATSSRYPLSTYRISPFCRDCFWDLPSLFKGLGCSLATFWPLHPLPLFNAL